MSRLSQATREKVEALKMEYGITEKQARYVEIDLREPDLPMSKKAELAGYGKGVNKTDGGRVLKSANIIRTKRAELAKRAKLEAEVKAFDENPRNYLKKKFLDFAHDPDITPNQTRNLELLGKMEGAFVERIEVDPGTNMRDNLFGHILNRANVSEETE